MKNSEILNEIIEHYVVIKRRKKRKHLCNSFKISGFDEKKKTSSRYKPNIDAEKRGAKYKKKIEIMCAPERKREKMLDRRDIRLAKTVIETSVVCAQSESRVLYS